MAEDNQPANEGDQRERVRSLLERIIEPPEPPEALFAKSFLEIVSLYQVAAALREVKAAAGPFERVENRGERWYAVFAKGEAQVQLKTDEFGRVVLLTVQPVLSRVFDFDSAVEELERVPGLVSYLIRRNGATLAARDPDRPCAVASAAKLAVLAATKDAVLSRRVRWDDVFSLDSDWRSLPSGVLHDWPVGTPLTISTFAAQMMSISDNTATDALISIIGAQNIERHAPHTRPFPTTRAMFFLKSAENEALRNAYIAADYASRLEILRAVADEPLVRASSLLTKPVLDLEWYLSARELCGLAHYVNDLPVARINPSFHTEGLNSMLYKGGSEPGVLNLTMCASGAAGRTCCASVTWNDPAQRIEEDGAVAAYRGLLQQIAAFEGC